MEVWCAIADQDLPFNEKLVPLPANGRRCNKSQHNVERLRASNAMDGERDVINQETDNTNSIHSKKEKED